MQETTRKQAKELKLTYYFTGKPCKHGHISKRDVNKGTCYECKLIHGRSAVRPESRKAYMKEYLSNYVDKNKSERSKAYYQENKEAEQKRSRIKQASNKAYYASKNAERRAAKKQATPLWIDTASIKIVYEKARFYGLEVDHVVPLQSNIVCGLHTWDNLQLLDRKLNAEKLNRYWPDMPQEQGV